MDIGKRIVELREGKDWNQRELARRAGLNASVMNRIETGERPVKDQELVVFAKLLDTSTDYLLGLTENRNPQQDLAAHRSDNHMDDLPDEAIKAIEEYKDFIRQKFAKNNKKGNA